jgi:hypothetical protein
MAGVILVLFGVIFSVDFDVVSIRAFFLAIYFFLYYK